MVRHICTSFLTIACANTEIADRLCMLGLFHSNVVTGGCKQHVDGDRGWAADGGAGAQPLGEESAGGVIMGLHWVAVFHETKQVLKVVMYIPPWLG
jgi:hypothetical protein